MVPLAALSPSPSRCPFQRVVGRSNHVHHAAPIISTRASTSCQRCTSMRKDALDALQSIGTSQAALLRKTTTEPFEIIGIGIEVGFWRPRVSNIERVLLLRCLPCAAASASPSCTAAQQLLCDSLCSGLSFSRQHT